MEGDHSMRYITTLGLLVLAVVLCATPGIAQYIPSGSYQQTCTDISVVNGSTLAARCQDVSGGWRSTRLTNFQDCSGEIVNDNGQLRCSKNGYYGGGHQGGYPGGYENGYQGSLPPGDYVQTCRNIRTYGNTMEAECEKRNGGWRRTSLSLDGCNGGIINNDGHLQCGSGSSYGGYPGGYQNGYQGGSPPGDYVQTCRNIRTNGNRLDAECQKRNGGWRRTSLSLDGCYGGIINNDGHLQCGSGYGQGSYPGDYSGGYRGSGPAGSYTQTCRNIRTNGNRLDADCQSRDGNWRHTTLDEFDRCRGEIANDNGHLMCSR
jgi:hypothetical protein